MFRNFLKTGWRNLWRDKQFTLLNSIGLSTGLACVLLIYLWVNDELHVDKFNEKDSQLYQVFKNTPNSDGTISTYGTTQALLAQEIAKSYPEIEYAVSMRQEDELGILSIGEKHIKASWEFAGKDFFNVFSYRLIEGSKQTVLNDNYSVLISDKTALKLFNSTKDVIGKTIRWDAGKKFSGSYIIKEVFEAPPSNATDQFDLIFNYSLFAEKEVGGGMDINNWGTNSVCTYLVLKKGTKVEKFNAKIKDFTKVKMKSLGMSEDWLKSEGDIFIQKYSDRYLWNHYENGKIKGGRIEYVHLFSTIAIFILVIACINFMNLSTAKAAGRMKEVGVRKIVGASRSLLITQYMAESMLMSFLAIILAVVIASLLLPAFKQITGKELSIGFNLNFIFSTISVGVITGIMAGSYPALYLSGFKPVMILKGKRNTSLNAAMIRKGLVVFQFAISVVLIIAVIIVYEQMQLIQTKNLGYNKDNIIRFSSEGNLKDHPEAFLTDVKKIPGVMYASSMDGDFLGHPDNIGDGIDWDGKNPNLGIEYFGVKGDYDFIELLGLKMKEGRSFSQKFGSDSSSVIFNESAIAEMGIKNPVGKTVSLWGKKKQIAGIVKNFHFESLYKKVGPAYLEYSPNNETMIIKIKAGTEKETIARIESFYKNFNQGLPFDFKFLDEDYQAMYVSEQRVAALSKYFAAIAIIISCLGLYGLAAFTAQKRGKEIGIRKVIGASVGNITAMLLKDFIRLVLIALFISFPTSWWLMNNWLQSFAYRIDITPWIFLVAALSVIVITLVTISFQSIKAAIANPVKSLRTE